MNTTNSHSREVRELNNTGTIYGINGPVIYLKGKTDFKMSEMRSWSAKSSPSTRI